MTTATQEDTGRLRFPETFPRDPSFGLLPRSGWQKRIWEELKPLLSRHGWSVRRAGAVYFYDFMIQICLDNWTLHFQVSRDGKEFANEAYGDLEGKALIAFDVEGGRGVKPSDLKQLQKEISAALRSSGVYEKLEVDEADLRQNHLVMDGERKAIDKDDVGFIAERLVEYMDAIYDVAHPVLERLQSQ